MLDYDGGQFTGFTHLAHFAELLRKLYLCNIIDGHAMNLRDYLKEAKIGIANIIHGQVISKMLVQKGPKEWRNLKNRVDVSQKRGSCADNESCSGLIEVREWSNEEGRKKRKAGRHPCEGGVRPSLTTCLWTLLCLIPQVERTTGSHPQA